MAASIFVYNSWSRNIARAADLSSTTFNVSLHTSTYTPNQDTHEAFADATNQLTTANGYTAGGQALASVTWNRAAAVTTFDAADTVWNATGAGITARYAIIRAVGTLNAIVDPLVAYILMDNTPADVTVPAGNPLTLQWNASGIFTVTRT